MFSWACQAAREAISPTIAYARQQDEEGRVQLAGKGVSINEIDDPQALQAKVAAVIENWSKKSPLISEFVETA